MIYLLLTIGLLLILIVYVISKIIVLYKRMKVYEDKINDYCLMNHEYINQLMVVMGYLDCKNEKKAREYLDSIIDEHKYESSYDIRQLSKLSDCGIKKLLYYKSSKMDKLKIEFYYYVDDLFASSFEKLSIIDNINITKIIGVLLDNAIDYTKTINDKIVEINLKKEDDKLVIMVSNSYEKGLNIKKIDNKGYTTKGLGHGFGLQIVNNIIKNNKKINIDTSINNNLFTQTVLVNL